ncbi:MAG: hypothetical protein KDB14_34280, partial [Planctomycetales bacterium]|nr:hypothetical protein [Planctomycetales bacterium]
MVQVVVQAASLQPALAWFARRSGIEQCCTGEGAHATREAWFARRSWVEQCCTGEGAHATREVCLGQRSGVAQCCTGEDARGRPCYARSVIRPAQLGCAVLHR